MPAEKAEGNARVPDKRQVKNSGHEGERTLGREKGKNQKLRELVEGNDEKDQAVERDYRRRFFFSSSSWHLMHREVWGTARSRFWGIGFSQVSHEP